jgi:hypothetical protein
MFLRRPDDKVRGQAKSSKLYGLTAECVTALKYNYDNYPLASRTYP